MTRLSSDRGSVTTEVVLVTPIAIVLLCLVAFVGRVTTATEQIQEAARDAARAATLERTPAAALAAAENIAVTSLTGGGVRCQQHSVAVDLVAFAPGGQVEVTVRCTVSLRDLELLGVPGTKTLEANAVAVLDTYRAAG